MKYKNLQELAAAFQSGELSKEHYKLVLDNDCSFLRYCGPTPEGIEEGSDAWWSFYDKKCDEAHDWFRGNGYSDLGDACTAAGIPNEWC
jgi:hypothetical protein